MKKFYRDTDKTKIIKTFMANKQRVSTYIFNVNANFR